MLDHRYKQQKSILLSEQQTDKEIRTDIQNKLMKHEMRKQEFK